MPSGSQLVSTSPMIGIRRRWASRTAISSVLRSTTNIASGTRCMFLTPPRFAWSLIEVGLGGQALARRQQRQLALGRVALEVVQALDAQRDRLEVRQQAAEPAVVDVRHPGRLGDLLDAVAGLLLGAHEQHGAAAMGDLGCELLRLRKQRLGLQQIDDVDPAALAVDEAAHLRVPAACLVAEVHAGLQQLADSYLSHGIAPLCRCEKQPGRKRGVRTRRSVAGQGRGLGVDSKGRPGSLDGFTSV